ncbi:MAG TPA: energy transducer TonB [Usitatibacteraceae bacterium]|nr:energy transducer TonB [Usitatibacteraceae bacterium]
MSRSLAGLLLAGVSVLSASAAEPAPGKPVYGEGRMLVLVSPQFPAAALAKGETGKVDVFGTIRTDGSLENVRIETSPPNESFESAVMNVVPLWRLQPRIVTPDCGAASTKGQVTIWFELDGGKPKVSYGTRPPPGTAPPAIHIDRRPIRTVTPNYPAKLAQDPKAPKSMVQVAYVAVAEDGAVTGVTLAPMLYYRDFEPNIVAAMRQWKFEQQVQAWCGEFEMVLAMQ